MTENDAATRATAYRRERRGVVSALVFRQMAVLIVIGGVLGAVYALDDGSREAVKPSVWLIALVMVVLVLILGNVLVLVLSRRRPRRGTAPFAVWELPVRRDRKDLLRALRRGDPIVPERRKLARRTATDLIGRRRVVWVFVAAAVVMAANAVIQPWANDFTTFSLVLGAVLLVVALLMLANAGYHGRLIRRMRRALSARARPARRDRR